MYRMSNKSQKTLIIVKRTCVAWYLPSADLLSYDRVSHSLDSSAIGLVFVSQIRQASSGFKAVFLFCSHSLKILAAPPLPHIPMADYFSLPESPKAAHLIPN